MRAGLEHTYNARLSSRENANVAYVLRSFIWGNPLKSCFPHRFELNDAGERNYRGSTSSWNFCTGSGVQLHKSVMQPVKVLSSLLMHFHSSRKRALSITCLLCVSSRVSAYQRGCIFLLHTTDLTVHWTVSNLSSLY